MIRALIKFILLATTGKVGIDLIKENKIAGIIFFLLSAGSTYSMLLELKIIDNETIPNILKFTIGLIAYIITKVGRWE